VDDCSQETTTTCPPTPAADAACGVDVVAEVLALCGGLASCDIKVTAAALNVTDPCADTAAKWLIVVGWCR